MTVKDYREKYISTIIRLAKEKNLNLEDYTRSVLSKLSFDELRLLAKNIQES